MADVYITKYRNSFSVYTSLAALRKVIFDFSTTLAKQPMNTNSNQKYNKYRKYDKPDEKIEFFYHRYESKDTTVFTIAQYDYFIDLIAKQYPPRGIGSYSIEVTVVDPVEGIEVEFDKNTLLMEEPDTSPFFFQNGVVDYACELGKYHVVFEVQAGRGKTKMAFKVIVRRGLRACIITKPAFIAKWESVDVPECLHLDEDEIAAPKTVIQLVKLIEQCNARLDDNLKIIICPSSLLENYFKAWENGQVLVHPSDMLRVLRIGTVVYDESHMWFKRNYISHIVMNSPYTLDLSATIDPGDRDAFLRDRYFERFPREFRYNKLKYHVYTEAYSIFYGIKDRKMLQRINSLKQYSHLQVEQMIMSNSTALRNYYDMCYSIILNMYLSKYKPGRKAIVFFSLKEMCTGFVKYLKSKPELAHLKITRNIEGDDYLEFITGDIGISTPGKSGTAVDIPGLMFSLITIPVNGKQLNIQMLGRPRDNRDPTDPPKVVYIHCNRVKKHMSYLSYRQEILSDKVTKFVIMNSRFSI